jgi:hypothetical protein
MLNNLFLFHTYFQAKINLLARTAVLKKTLTTLIYVGQSYSSVGHKYTQVGQTRNLSFT